ncbi:HAD family hydrolase [Paenalkalicoccus suaedae]|uniref:HAD family hydrolase n=1 Tax=Paenalkalicoccus suaedae TaxID=2592382 RepID=A0A859FET0_9BACI|nr:HAD family hydrolase [Paenalkalicoccus suaedae]QKS70735.1 HAD family hydrolase [Paenalkalicoccus suaedae]
MTYRIVALDIDGTLLRDNEKIQRETKEAIHSLQDKGVFVTLVTGRSYVSAERIMKQLRLKPFPLITHEGAFIGQDSKYPLAAHRLTPEFVLDNVRHFESYHCHMKLYGEKRVLANRHPEKSQLLKRMTIKASEPLLYSTTYVDSLSDHLIEKPDSFLHMDIEFIDAEERRSAETGSFPSIRINDRTLRIVHPKASKLQGLLHICKLYQIKQEEIVAVGACERDRDMLQYAGLGVAMGQAPKEVKDVADWVTRSNEELGVAYMIKEVFRKQYSILM